MTADIRPGSTRAGPAADHYCLTGSRCRLGNCTPADRQEITQFFANLVEIIETVTRRRPSDGDPPSRPLLDQES